MESSLQGAWNSKTPAPPPLGPLPTVTAELGKVGGFGAVEAQEAVPVAFNGAFLPSTVGMAVVDGDMKEGFKRVFMEKL